MNITAQETASQDMDSIPDRYRQIHIGHNRIRLRKPRKENVKAI